MDAAFLAVDLGAESGRAVMGRFDGEQITLEEVHRFPNVPVRLPDGLHWDVLRIAREVKDGIAKATRNGRRIESVGVDAWGVDFALLDREGLRSDAQRGDIQDDGHPVHADKHPLPASGDGGFASSPGGTIAAPHPRPRKLLAHRREGLRVHRRQHHPALRRAFRWLGPWPSGEYALSRPHLWRDHPAWHPTRSPVAGGRRGDRSERGIGSHGRGLPRYRLRRGRCPCRGRGFRIYLQRHLVPGRRGTAETGYSAGGYARQLYQRGRLRRHDAIPEERHGPLASAGVPTHL